MNRIMYIFYYKSLSAIRKRAHVFSTRFFHTDCLQPIRDEEKLYSVNKTYSSSLPKKVFLHFSSAT